MSRTKEEEGAAAGSLWVSNVLDSYDSAVCTVFAWTILSENINCCIRRVTIVQSGTFEKATGDPDPPSTGSYHTLYTRTYRFRYCIVATWPPSTNYTSILTELM